MRIIGLIVWVGVMGVIAVALIGCSSQKMVSNEPLGLYTVHVAGKPLYSTNEGAWNQLKRGDRLKAETTIKAGDATIVDLMIGDLREEFSDGINRSLRATRKNPDKEIRVFQNSSLKIEIGSREGFKSWDSFGKTIFNERIVLILNSGAICGDNRSDSENPIHEIKLDDKTIFFAPNSIYLITTSGGVELFRGKASIFLTKPSLTVRISAKQEFDFESRTVKELSEQQMAQFYVISPRLSALDGDSDFVVHLPSSKGSGMGGSWRKF